MFLVHRVERELDAVGEEFLELRLDLSEAERQRVRLRSRNYQQFLRLLAALEVAESLRTRVLMD